MTNTYFLEDYNKPTKKVSLTEMFLEQDNKMLELEVESKDIFIECMNLEYGMIIHEDNNPGKIKKVLKNIEKALKKLWETIVNFFTTIVDKIKNWFRKLMIKFGSKKYDDVTVYVSSKCKKLNQLQNAKNIATTGLFKEVTNLTKDFLQFGAKGTKTIIDSNPENKIKEYQKVADQFNYLDGTDKITQMTGKQYRTLLNQTKKFIDDLSKDEKVAKQSYKEAEKTYKKLSKTDASTKELAVANKNVQLTKKILDITSDCLHKSVAILKPKKNK